MKDKEFEKELFQSLDSICANELEGLQETVELTAQHMTLDDGTKARISSKALGKAGITMSDNKHENRINLSKKKRISVIAAFAAAAAITVTAGAYAVTDGFKGADHDKAVQKVLGEANISSEAKTDKTGHLKIRSENMLCDGRYAVLAVSLEPVDEIGEQYINDNKFVSLDMGWQHNADGYSLGFDSYGGSTSKVIDGCIFVFGTIELTPPYGYPDDWELGDETITGTAKIDLAMTDAQIINGDGDEISEINYEIKKNADFITLKGDKGHGMELSPVSMRVDGMIYRTDNHPINGDTNEPIEDEYEYDDSGINVGYNDDETMAVEYSDGTKEVFVGNDTLSFISYNDTGDADEMGFDIAFKKEIYTERVTAVTINGERFTVEQS